MGYYTEFRGEIEISPVLKDEHKAYLDAFCETRRMKRDEEKVAKLPDPLREAVGLPVGPEGAFYVAGVGFMGQDRDESIVDYNKPPGLPSYSREIPFLQRWEIEQEAKKSTEVQPSLWCPWEVYVSSNNKHILWIPDEGKHYNYIEWLRYLIANFFQPWGYTLNGTVQWRGEEWDDSGAIRVQDNSVEII